MKSITSAKFLKGLTGTNETLEDGTPQVALLGRSNVGKSSIINSLTKQKDLARTSAYPGLTQELNVYWINKSLYLIDLPGYGFAMASQEGRERLQKLIYWYLFDSGCVQKKVLLIIDANVGPTDKDSEVLASMEKENKNIVIVANKIDKIKKLEYESKMKKLAELVGEHKIIPYSAKERIGVSELTQEILG
ncbi:MAG: ribosome bioproteinis GTP-binding protein YsxC/EngB [Parcubacteria group bacterium Gr01-1014_20]|nr:MAG: ribosome bioproteinis GTP-binding protein YsxC/EngB [Parcubacteria group bacterium Gr01-1014_20]